MADATGPIAGAGTSGPTSVENSGGGSKRTRRSDGDPEEPGFEGGVEATGTKIGDDDWARARELFLKATTESARKGCR